MKTLSLVAVLGLALFISCQGNPQKKAEDRAKSEAREAESHADKAETHMEKGVEQANQAAEHATREAMNSAIAAVEVPTFDNLDAENLAKKIGNHAVDFINSQSNEEAGKFTDRLTEDLDELSSKMAKGSISSVDGSKIRTYANNLAKALGVTIN